MPSFSRRRICLTACSSWRIQPTMCMRPQRSLWQRQNSSDERFWQSAARSRANERPTVMDSAKDATPPHGALNLKAVKTDTPHLASAAAARRARLAARLLCVSGRVPVPPELTGDRESSKHRFNRRSSTAGVVMSSNSSQSRIQHVVVLCLLLACAAIPTNLVAAAQRTAAPRKLSAVGVFQRYSGAVVIVEAFDA